MYDIFFISNNTEVEKLAFRDFKLKYPFAKHATTYEEAKKKSFTKLFWIVWSDIIVSDSFDFKFDVPIWDYKYIHVFKNGEFFNGICLSSKETAISKKELEYRFFINKKEIDIVASTPRPYDIFFISYNEANADDNYNILTKRFPNAQRISGINGIHQAHIVAAQLASSKMFWVVDGDAKILDTFNFDYTTNELDTVYVWRSRNPVNGLEYGYGGVKLLPKFLTLNMDVNSVDMTMGISNKFKALPEVSNITAFNTDPFSSWRSAFRECCKLAVINNEESLVRLNRWCTIGNDIDTIHGALAGKKYGQENASNKEALSKINDFTWLKDQWSLEIFQQSL